MKKWLQEQLKAKEAQRSKLVDKSKEATDVEILRAINIDIEAINAEIATFRAKIDDLDSDEEKDDKKDEDEVIIRGKAPEGQLKPLGTYSMGGGEPKARAKTEANEAAEKRGKDLLAKRSVTVASSDLVLPKYASDTINSTFNEVSSLIDRVKMKQFKGGESFEQPYINGYGEGDYTTEGGVPATAEPTFGYAPISKTKIAAYAEDSEEVLKLPAADYDGEVQKGIRIALRKKGTKEILIGDGATGHYIGIFSALAEAIDVSTDKVISSIDEDTLDEVMYSFGGDEDVEDTAVLILNKMDLKEFATLRNPSTGMKVYKVKSKGNYGTIDGVPYIINSACKSIVAGDVGDYCMAYGPLSNYTMGIFSDVDITRSTDYKFKEGMIAHRGVVFAGGNVTSKNGFLRVKKG